ncbi:MAG TPA: hypothetical protein VL357_12880 [Rariglobus sp.]|jgi:hypothetical protein|nr:hypothetical protein [Rariglobus sp.]
MKPDDEFYIGYLPKAPADTGRFTRRVVIGVVAGAMVLGGLLAAVLPFYGEGIFEFGHPRVYRGDVLCDGMARLSSEEVDYLLVGPGKHGAPLEVCGAAGQRVTVEATRIARDGAEALEVVPGSLKIEEGGVHEPKPDAALGEFTLKGEIVDPKCYFGVMNPGEGRLHRACAILCLRGGIPPLLVVRDRAGKEIHVALTVPDGETTGLLERVAEPVEVTGRVRRSGQWLVMDTKLAHIRAVAGP